MAANRLPYFPFHVDDYLNDRAVVQMDADAEGCYVRLLCRSWQSAEPGVIFAGHVRELCGGHRIAEQYRLLWEDDVRGVDHGELDVPEIMAKTRWDDVEDQLASAFDTESRPGFWIQRRMVAEYRRACTVKERQKSGADKTNEIKAVTRSPYANRPVTARSPLGNREVEVEVEVDKNKTGLLAHASENLLTPWLDDKAAVRLINYLRTTGTEAPESIVAVLEHWKAHRIKKPLAYYDASGPARSAVIMEAHISRAEAEHERLKKQGLA